MPALNTLVILSLVFLLVTVVYFLQRGDELPIVIAGLGVLMLGRAWLAQQGIIEWGSFDYGISFVYDTNYVVRACAYILLGTVCLAGTYMLFSQRPEAPPVDREDIWRHYLRLHQGRVWVGLLIFLAISAVASRTLVLDFEESGHISNNYAMLFSLAGSSFMIGLVMLGRSLYAGRDFRLVLYGIAVALGLTTITYSMRFRFLGWAIVVLIVLVQQFRPWIRLGIFAGAFVLVGVAFSVMGILRHDWAQELDWKGRLDAGIEALMSGGDINFVDGMVMVLQVYPDVVPYSYGAEHLDILLRPIPRALWPGKPVGGWQQKYARMTGQEDFGVGISPSLYGSFYAEGGVMGIVLLAVLYGVLASGVAHWYDGFRSELGPVLKGAMIAGTFAIIRGGDLAGTVAFVAMSYWPLAFFLYGYPKFAAARLSREAKGKDGGAAKHRPLSARAMPSAR